MTEKRIAELEEDNKRLKETLNRALQTCGEQAKKMQRKLTLEETQRISDLRRELEGYIKDYKINRVSVELAIALWLLDNGYTISQIKETK